MTMPDIRALPRNDQAFLGLGLVAFIATFFPFDGISIYTENAWHGIGILGSLLVIVSVLIGLAQLLMPQSLPRLAISWTMVGGAVAMLAAIIFIIHWLALPSYDNGFVHISLSLKWGGYFLIIVTIVQSVFGFLRFRATGERLPWESGAAPPPAV